MVLVQDSVAFDRGFGKILATGGEEGVVRIWGLSGHEEVVLSLVCLFWG